jgi:hypothetical protein
MKSILSIRLTGFTVALLLVAAIPTIAQTVIPIPPHSSVFTGNSRGYWFTSPTDFIITGVRAPIDFSTMAQSVHLVKFTTPPPLWSATTTAFTTLHYVANLADTGFIPLNIQVNTGDIIGVIAIRVNATGSSQTSYAASNPVASTIGNFPVTLQRLGWQGHINNSPAVDFWTETGSSLGRAEIRYVMSLPSDGALTGFVSIGDSICSGPNSVVVMLKNNGPNTINQATIGWEANSTLQTAHNWTGSLAVNDSITVNVGSYSFQTGISYNIKCYLNDVNSGGDSLPHNDTIMISGVQIKPTPAIVVNDTTLAICQGDTAWISGTLTGTPPWSFTIKEGTTSHPFTGLTTSSFNIPMTPATSRTYTIEAITDGTGCEKAVGPSVAVSVQAAPPANITPMGPPAACMGDSVMLMGSVGLNFTYQWHHDGTLIPGATNYLLAAKAGGNYTVMVTSPIGCSKLSAPYTVYIHPLPAVSLGNDTALLPHQSILLNAGTGFNSYLWSTGATSASLLVDTAGAGIGVQTIWVNVTDNNTCKGGDTILINFTPHPAVEGIDTEATLNIFPNPTNGMVTLELGRFPMENITVEVYGADGKVAYSRQHAITGENEQIRLNLQHLSDGLYHIRVLSKGGMRTGAYPVIIKR